MGGSSSYRGGEKLVCTEPKCLAIVARFSRLWALNEEVRKGVLSPPKIGNLLVVVPVVHLRPMRKNFKLSRYHHYIYLSFKEGSQHDRHQSLLSAYYQVLSASRRGLGSCCELCGWSWSLAGVATNTSRFPRSWLRKVAMPTWRPCNSIIGRYFQ